MLLKHDYPQGFNNLFELSLCFETKGSVVIHKKLQELCLQLNPFTEEVAVILGIL